MPKSHREYFKWNPSRIIRWARTTGKFTAEVVESIMASLRHPEQGYRSCMGIMRLGKRYSNERLEAACGRALSIGALSYRSFTPYWKRVWTSIRRPIQRPTRPSTTKTSVDAVRNYKSLAQVERAFRSLKGVDT